MIFGFNRKETFDKICQIYSEYIIDAIDRIGQKQNDVNESYKNIEIEKVNNNWKKIIVFYEAWLSGISEHTKKGFDILKHSVRELERFLERSSSEISDEQKEVYELAIENGHDILERCTLLEFHQFI